MTVLFAIDGWGHGSHVGTFPRVYTMATPDIPNGHTVNYEGTRAVDSNPPWNGATLLDCTANWYDGAVSTVSSATANATSGRVLFQTTIQTAQVLPVFSLLAAVPGNFRLRVRRTSATNLQFQINWGGFGSDAIIDFTYPSNPYNAEIIYNTNGATNADRLKARIWDVGASAGSFTSTSSSTTAGTSDQPTGVNLGEYNNGESRAKFHRLLLSDDINEDLSTWTPGGGIVIPRNIHHLRQQGLL